jgi:hypothetical protein
MLLEASCGVWGPQQPACPVATLPYQSRLHRFEVGDLCSYSVEMAGCQVPHLDTRAVSAFVGERQQRADFIQGEAKVPCPPDEGEGPAFHVSVLTAPAGGARRMRHHADAFVVADRLDIYPGAPGEFAD